MKLAALERQVAPVLRVLFYAVEDRHIAVSLSVCGGRDRWTKAALLVPGRTDNMCVRRWTTLQRWDKNGPPQPRPPKPPAGKAANKRKAASAKRGDDAAAPAAPESRPANPASEQDPGGAEPGPRARKAPAAKAAKKRKAASANRADAANPVSGTGAPPVNPAGGAAPSSVSAGGRVGAVADAGAGPGPNTGGAAAPGRATGGGESSAASAGQTLAPTLATRVRWQRARRRAPAALAGAPLRRPAGAAVPRCRRRCPADPLMAGPRAEGGLTGFARARLGLQAAAVQGLRRAGRPRGGDFSDAGGSLDNDGDVDGGTCHCRADSVGSRADG